MKDVKKDIFWRVYLVYLGMFVFALIILGRVIHLQIFQGEYWKKKAKELTVDYKTIEAIRGDITAYDGNLLATSVPIFEIRMDTKSSAIKKDFFYNNVDSLAICLSNLFKDMSAKEYKKNIINARKKNDRYFLIKRDATYPELKKMRTFPIFRAGKYKGGMIVIQKAMREMPFKLLAARTIGFEREGIYVGLEGSYSKYIEGTCGKRLMQKVGPDIWIPLSDENEIEPENGSDVVTTLDINIQDVAENALMRQLSLFSADHGCAVLMEVATGKIRAIANLTRNGEGQYVEMFNYAISESSEPGSTFKLASVISVLEDGYVDIYDKVNTLNGKIRYADREMEDSHEGGGIITVKKAFEQSSNVGISRIIYDNYSKDPQKYVDHLYSMNLNKPLGLDLLGEGNPQIKNTESRSWSRVSLPWMAIGYEVALTPLQILTFYNAVANNGKMVKPLFVEEVKKTGKTIKKNNVVVINKSICSKKTLEKVRLLLEGVVECGTASNIKNSVYKIAGKTGTAQVANRKFGYKHESGINYKASFVGYFPADNPKYSCIVVINNPKGAVYYGSTVSAPVFKEIADKVFATRIDVKPKDTLKTIITPIAKSGNQNDLERVYHKLNYFTISSAPDADWVSTANFGNAVKMIDKSFKKEVVPNVVGMGAKDAVFLLENSGLKVRISGRGTVKKQSLPAGTRIMSGYEIILELS